MGLSKLSIWIRDTAHPCLPYESTGHSWVAAILSCGLKPLHFAAVKNGLFPLTDPGKAGGRVHGQVEVPPGCYIVVAFSTCKNVFTDMAMVQVGCNTEVCVNLITKRLSTCTGQLIAALNVAAVLGPGYNPSSAERSKIPKEVISKAIEVLQELNRHMPPDPVLPALPVSIDDLKKMAEKEQGKQAR